MTEGDSSSPSYKCFKTYDEIKRGINDLNKNSQTDLNDLARLQRLYIGK